MTDIAATSVEQCESRYRDMRQRGRGRGNFHEKMFDAEFVVADCTKVWLFEDQDHVLFHLEGCWLGLLFQ